VETVGPQQGRTLGMVGAPVEAVLAETSPVLSDIARVVSDAYMACHAALGPEWHAIGAAMRGDAQMLACQQQMLDGYADVFHAALAPASSLPADVVQRRCVAIIGAAEALSDAMVRERVTEQAAADELCSLILAWLTC